MPKTKRELFEGVVEGAEVRPETIDREIIKLMKVIQIVRMPSGRIAKIDLKTKTKDFELEIDEATARAIWNVFEEDRKAKP